MVALLSQLPQFAGAFVLLGSVATQLPYGPSLAVQFANNFTGFVAGSVGTTAMIIRYFQRQGLAVAIAVSSGVLKTLSSMIVEAILVVIALVLTWGDFDVSSAGGSDSGGGTGSTLILLVIIVGGVGLAAVVTIPKLRRRVHSVVAPQLATARNNLKQIAGMPMKMLQLFGGNLASELLFAMVLMRGAARLRAVAAPDAGRPDQLLRLAHRWARPDPRRHGRRRGRTDRRVHRGRHPAGRGHRGDVHGAHVHDVPSPIWGWFALNWLRRRSLV